MVDHGVRIFCEVVFFVQRQPFCEKVAEDAKVFVVVLFLLLTMVDYESNVQLMRSIILEAHRKGKNDLDSIHQMSQEFLSLTLDQQREWENEGDVMTMIFNHKYYPDKIVASTPENPESDEEYEKIGGIMETVGNVSALGKRSRCVDDVTKNTKIGVMEW